MFDTVSKSSKHSVPEWARGILLDSYYIEGRALLVAKGTESDDARLLTTEEISGILKVSLNTVQNRVWRKRNGCPLFKIGKRTYVFKAVFWNWVHEKGMIANEETG